MNDTRTQVVVQGDAAALCFGAARLSVVDGPDRGASAELGPRRFVVGSAPECDLTLSDSAVSRQHLAFELQDDGYAVRDLKSTNGTFYRGARVQEVRLGASAELRLGETVLRLEPLGERSQVIGRHPRFGSLVGVSEAMQQVFGVLAAVAPTEATVLIEGETGTGKELVAREIHRGSSRAAGPLCVVDCGSLPSQLIESELFGHTKGAFTGATSEREGVFERARRGTIFLDELGELPLALQTRLLRVLEQRTIRRVGDNVDRRVDVRVVAATNRGLDAEVDAGRFRSDLFYRLAVVRLRLPALRERVEDIEPLAGHFLWDVGCVDAGRVLRPDVLEALRSRAWPGNVRELRNLIERVVLLADGAGADVLEHASDSPVAPRPGEVADGAAGPASAGAAKEPAWDEPWLLSAMPSGYLERPFRLAKEMLVEQFERLYIGRLLDRHGHNITQLAREAGIDRAAVRKLLRRHGLDQ